MQDQLLTHAATVFSGFRAIMEEPGRVQQALGRLDRALTRARGERDRAEDVESSARERFEQHPRSRVAKAKRDEARAARDSALSRVCELKKRQYRSMDALATAKTRARMAEKALTELVAALAVVAASNRRK